jgi:hypothetical protein
MKREGKMARWAAILPVFYSVPVSFLARQGKPLSCLAAGLLLGMGVCRFEPFIGALPWLSVATGCTRCSVRGGTSGAISGEQFESVRAQLRDASRQVRYLGGLLDSADTELAVERGARIELEDELRALTMMAGQVQDELALYEQLLPPGPQGVATIRGARFEAAAGGLRYRVLLGRTARRGKPPFRGRLQFLAEGMSKGQRHIVELLPAVAVESIAVESSKSGAAAESSMSMSSAAAESSMSMSSATAVDAAVAEARSESLRLDFETYQRNEGILSLQQGFVPETVTVNAVQDGVVRASRTVRVILIRPAAAL